MKINRFDNYTKENKNSVKEFQNKRIDAFESLKKELDELKDAFGDAKTKTIEYYSKNPNSWAVLFPTDGIFDKLSDIREDIGEIKKTNK